MTKIEFLTGLAVVAMACVAVAADPANATGKDRQKAADDRGAGTSWSPLGIGLLPELQFPGEDDSVYGLDLGLVGSARPTVGGLQTGGLIAFSDADCYGVQVGGLGALSQRDCYGVQIAGLVSSSSGDCYGVQIGGLGAIAGLVAVDVKGACRGVQIGGLAAGSEGKCYGLQMGCLGALAKGGCYGLQVGGLAADSAEGGSGLMAGCVTSARNYSGLDLGVFGTMNEHFTGMSVALANRASDSSCIQCGLFNWMSGQSAGVQIGIFNWNGEKFGFPLINIVKN